MRQLGFDSAEPKEYGASRDCNACALHERCLTKGLSPTHTEEFGALLGGRRRIGKGQYLFHSSESFEHLYAVRFGHFKLTRANMGGDSRITGFYMAGDIIGFDGISDGAHHSDAIAIEDSEVCSVRYSQLESLTGKYPTIRRQLYRTMSAQLRDEQGMWLMDSLRSEQRLSAFILGLSERYAERGYSPHEFVLRMSRAEIGSYLGLTIETVCRLIKRLKILKLIGLNGNRLHIFQPELLRRLSSGSLTSLDDVIISS